jgi:hypothetical protein
MKSFDPRDLRLHACVESADAQRRRHFRSGAMSGGPNDFVSVWVSPAEEDFPLTDGDRLIIESAPDGIAFAQELHGPATVLAARV